MNVLPGVSRSLTRTISLTAFAFLLPLYLTAQQPDSTTVADSTVAAADSTAVSDSTKARPVKPLDPLVAFRARSALSPMYVDKLPLRKAPGGTFTHSFAFFADDVLRLAPMLTSGDSLGNGYPRRFSSLGGGFASTGAFLDGIELADPLTFRVDWRMLPAEILARAVLQSGGAQSGASGWSDEVHLFTHNPAAATAESHMGISGGAYEINKVSGGVRRTLFGSGAVQVQINKIQQSTEDFSADIENIQYYTRVQQQLSPRALLAMDGLFFSNDFRQRGFSKRRTAATRFRTSLTGALDNGIGYALAYGYASGGQPFATDSSTITAGAASHRLDVSLLSDQKRSVSLAADFSLSSTSLNDFPEAYQPGDSRSASRAAARVGLGGDGPLQAVFTAGLRAFTGGGSKPVGGARFSLAQGETGSLWLSWNRESVAPSPAATLSEFGTLDPAGGITPGSLDHVETGWGGGYGSIWSWSLAAFHRRLDKFPVEPYGARPFSSLPIRRVSAGLSGVRIRAAGRLFGWLDTELAGVETLDRPDDFLWLPARRYSAVLGMSGEGYGGDLGWSLRAETVYEGAMRYPLGESESSPVREQPGRINLFGAASLRIVDFTIFARADFLVSDYYNGVDPLSLPGPRAVVGIDWLFWD